MLALCIFSLKNTNALAATQKNVSVTVQQSFTATSTELNSQLSSYMSSHNSYNYDDGSYKGTLNITNVNLVSQTLQSRSSNLYNYIFAITYSGVATKYPVTKRVSVIVQQTFTATSAELSSHLNSYMNSHNTYNYNDGSYSGTLSISNVSLVSQTLQYPNSTIYNYVFAITYAGIATSY